MIPRTSQTMAGKRGIRPRAREEQADRQSSPRARRSYHTNRPLPYTPIRGILPRLGATHQGIAQFRGAWVRTRSPSWWVAHAPPISTLIDETLRILVLHQRVGQTGQVTHEKMAQNQTVKKARHRW